MNWLNRYNNSKLSRRHDGNFSQFAPSPAAAFITPCTRPVAVATPARIAQDGRRADFLPPTSAASPTTTSESADVRRRTPILHSPVQVDQRYSLTALSESCRALVRVQAGRYFLTGSCTAGRCSAPADRVLRTYGLPTRRENQTGNNLDWPRFDALSRRGQFSSHSLLLPMLYPLGIGQGLGKGSGNARRTRSTARTGIASTLSW